MIYREQIAKRFSHKASVYDQNAAIQQKIADELFALIKEQHYTNILDLGCGTGYLTKKLSDKYEGSKVSGIDISTGMLRQACDKVPRANFVCAAIEDISDLGEKFDLITSSVVLHWIDDLNSCMGKIVNSLSSGGVCYFSIPIHGSFIEFDEAFGQAYQVHKMESHKHMVEFPTIAKIEESVSLDFDIVDRFVEDYQLNFETARDSLNSIKNIGGNYTFGMELSFSQKKKIFSSMFKYYNDNFKTSDGSVSQTWKVLYITLKAKG